MNIFLARNNQQAGPYTLQQLNQMLASGQVLLTDLMWHDGMENWQSVRDMTQGQFIYHPLTHLNDEHGNDDDPIINNTPSQAQTAVSEKSESSESVWDRYANNNPHRLNKQSQPRSMDVSAAKKQLDLAPIGSRILAKLIDTILFMLPNLILWITIKNSPKFSDFNDIANSRFDITSYDAFIQYANRMNAFLESNIPTHISVLVSLLFFGLLLAQLALLLRRGQSIGKMALGIRILDRQSNAIPDFTHLIVLRTVLTAIVYSLGILGLMALMVDFITLFTNEDRQSLHDKIAKTYVVRADDTQTTPLELTPDA